MTAFNFKKQFIVLLILVIPYEITPLIFAQDHVISSVAKEYVNSKSARISAIIAKKLNCKLKMVYAPFARRLVLMEEGQIDFMVGLYRLPEREKYIHFLDPPYQRQANKYFFVLKESKTRILKYEDLYQLRVGTKIGSKYFPRFDNDSDINKFSVSTLEQNFEMLLLERIDVVINSYTAGMNQIRKMGIEDKIKIAQYYTTEENPVYIGISKKSRLIQRSSEMENIIKKMVSSGHIKTILETRSITHHD